MLATTSRACYALVTRLRYEDRETVADRGLLAVASATKPKIVLHVRRLAERAGFTKQVSVTFILTEPFNKMSGNTFFATLRS